jgi:hypothetical protein
MKLVNASDFAGVEDNGNCTDVKFSGDCAGVFSRAREEVCNVSRPGRRVERAVSGS